MRKLLFLLMCWTAPASAAGIVNFLLASPNLTGQAGQTVGWGLTMSVQPGFYATVIGSNYVQDGTQGSQVGYSSGIGVFASDGPDIIGFNGGPSPNFYVDSTGPWFESFSWVGNPGSTGVRAFQICSVGDAACGFEPAVGATENGFLTVDYLLSTDGVNWDDSGSSGPIAVSVTVEAARESATTPEPGTIGLATVSLIAVMARRRVWQARGSRPTI
jgi:hypothetical protein